jgi:hypothetical protein
MIGAGRTSGASAVDGKLHSVAGVHGRPGEMTDGET